MEEEPTNEILNSNEREYVEKTRIQSNVVRLEIKFWWNVDRIFFGGGGLKEFLGGKRGIDREIFACAIIWNSLSRKVTQVGRVKRNCDTLGERQRARSNRCRANNAARFECCHLSTEATDRSLATRIGR